MEAAPTDVEKAVAPLLNKDAPRSDGVEQGSECQHIYRAAGALVLTASLLLGVIQREAVAAIALQVVDWPRKMREALLAYALASPVRYLALLYAVLAVGAVVMWLGSWILAERKLFFVRTAASRQGVLAKLGAYGMGLFSLSLYVLDVWSDVLVAALLWSTRNTSGRRRRRSSCCCSTASCTGECVSGGASSIATG